MQWRMINEAQMENIEVSINWDSISSDIKMNLAQNGFINLVKGNKKPWMNFMFSSLNEIKKFIKKDGIIILVIGDVVKSNKTAISLARELLRNLYHQKEFKYIGCINDKIVASEKTTKIWKETKGKATETDRILILSDSKPILLFDELEKELLINPSQKEDLDFSKLEINAKKLAGIQ